MGWVRSNDEPTQTLHNALPTTCSTPADYSTGSLLSSQMQASSSQSNRKTAEFAALMPVSPTAIAPLKNESDSLLCNASEKVVTLPQSEKLGSSSAASVAAIGSQTSASKFSFSSLFDAMPIRHWKNGLVTSSSRSACRTSRSEDDMPETVAYDWQERMLSAYAKEYVASTPQTRLEHYRVHIRHILESIWTEICVALLVLWSMSAPDIRQIVAYDWTTEIFEYVDIICFTGLTLELMARSFCNNKYFLRSYFWLDFVATVSILFELSSVRRSLLNLSHHVQGMGTKAEVAHYLERVAVIIRMPRLLTALHRYNSSLTKHKAKQSVQIVRRRIKFMFRFVDEDMDGRITFRQFQHSCRYLGIEPPVCLLPLPLSHAHCNLSNHLSSITATNALKEFLHSFFHFITCGLWNDKGALEPESSPDLGQIQTGTADSNPKGQKNQMKLSKAQFLCPRSRLGASDEVSERHRRISSFSTRETESYSNINCDVLHPSSLQANSSYWTDTSDTERRDIDTKNVPSDCISTSSKVTMYTVTSDNNHILAKGSRSKRHKGSHVAVADQNLGAPIPREIDAMCNGYRNRGDSGLEKRRKSTDLVSFNDTRFEKAVNTYSRKGFTQPRININVNDADIEDKNTDSEIMKAEYAYDRQASTFSSSATSLLTSATKLLSPILAPLFSSLASSSPKSSTEETTENLHEEKHFKHNQTHNAVLDCSTGGINSNENNQNSFFASAASGPDNGPEICNQYESPCNVDICNEDIGIPTAPAKNETCDSKLRGYQQLTSEPQITHPATTTQHAGCKPVVKRSSSLKALGNRERSGSKGNVTFDLANFQYNASIPDPSTGVAVCRTDALSMAEAEAVHVLDSKKSNYSELAECGATRTNIRLILPNKEHNSEIVHEPRVNPSRSEGIQPLRNTNRNATMHSFSIDRQNLNKRPYLECINGSGPGRNSIHTITGKLCQRIVDKTICTDAKPKHEASEETSDIADDSSKMEKKESPGCMSPKHSFAAESSLYRTTSFCSLKSGRSRKPSDNASFISSHTSSHGSTGDWWEDSLDAGSEEEIQMNFREFETRIVNADSSGVLLKWAKKLAFQRDAATFANEVAESVLFKVLLGVILIVISVGLIDSFVISRKSQIDEIGFLELAAKDMLLREVKEKGYSRINDINIERRRALLIGDSTQLSRSFINDLLQTIESAKGHGKAFYLYLYGVTVLDYRTDQRFRQLPENFLYVDERYDRDELTIKYISTIESYGSPVNFVYRKWLYKIASGLVSVAHMAFANLAISTFLTTLIIVGLCFFNRDSGSLAQKLVKPLQLLAEDVENMTYLDSESLQTADHNKRGLLLHETRYTGRCMFLIVITIITALSKIHEIRQLQETFKMTKQGLISFSKYVPREVVGMTMRRGEEAKLGGEAKVLTIMFSDIIGFTTIAENLHPRQLLRLLSEYFEAMSNIIVRSRGTLIEFIGDAILTVWNAPLSVHSHTAVAIVQALKMRCFLAQRQPHWDALGLPPINIRIGIHTAKVGNLGSPERFKFGVLGDGVNLASRLEELNKRYGTTILMSKAAAEQPHVATRFLIRPVDVVVVKGRTKGTELYEVMNFKSCSTTTELMIATKQMKALERYLNKDFKEALKYIAEIERASPSRYDSTVQELKRKCHKYITDPPPKDWNGAEVLKEKHF